MQERDLPIILLQILSQITLYHWQTDSYAEHKAFDEFYSNFQNLTDQFIEVYQGKNSRIYIDKDSLDIHDYPSNEAIRENFIPTLRDFLKDDLESLIQGDDDLLNLRDEMLSELNKLSYLLTLN